MGGSGQGLMFVTGQISLTDFRGGGEGNFVKRTFNEDKTPPAAPGAAPEIFPVPFPH